MTKNKSGILDGLVSHICLALYGYMCVSCGQPATDAHHWYRTKGAGGRRLRWNLVNLIPLCRECHTKTHAGEKAHQDPKAEAYLQAIYARGPLKLTDDDMDYMIATARNVLALCEDAGCAEGLRRVYIEGPTALDFLVEGL